MGNSNIISGTSNIQTRGSWINRTGEMIHNTKLLGHINWVLGGVCFLAWASFGLALWGIYGRAALLVIDCTCP